MSQYPPFQELNAARKRLIEKEQSQPDMVNLAMLASLARKIEPELLHALRFSLSDRFSVDRRPTVRTEAALWFSPFIESRGPDGITFLPAFSELLRERLKIEGSLLEAAHQVIQECHKNSPPIIHLEEELIYLSMSRCIMETERRQLLEQNIWRVVKAISTGKRRGLEEWIVEMWPRLPETACKNPLLAQLRNVSEIKILQYDSPASSKSNFTKLAKVDFSHVTTVVLDVQLVRDILRIGFLFDEGKIGFRVPNIEPITLGIQFPTVSRIITARVVPYGEFIDISAKSGPALIRTIDGQIYQIDPKLFEKQEIVGKPLTSDIFQPHILKEEPYVRELISGEQAASLYLFSWDEIPGNDNSRLIDYLKFNFNIDWVKTAKIEKTNDGDIIKVSNKENYLSLRLNDAKTKVILKINEDTTDEFTVKLEKGKLKICTYPTIERSVTKFIDAENEQKQRKEDKKYHITNKIKWPLEAEDLRIDALNYIHKTDGIKNFLEGNGLYIVCGLKGLGKTLVLRAKRMKYLELKTNTLQSYVMIPESEQVDVLASFNLLEYKWDLINNSVIWSNIWGLSIGLSIISHFFTRLDDKNKESLNWKLKQILKVRDKRHNNYLRLLLDYTTKLQSNPSRFVLLTLNSINKNILDANLFSELYANIFDILKQDIRSGCVVFIDQVDKTLEEFMTMHSDELYKLNKLQEILYACQIGLIKAVVAISTRNHHITIYTSIGQEVLGIISKDPNFIRYEDKMLMLSYEKEDLRKIFIKSIELENEENLYIPNLIKSDPIKAFLGFDKVNSSRNPKQSENIFDYMYRHTIQRPRDILYIGSRISIIEPNERSKANVLKSIIASSENITLEYLGNYKRLMNIDFDYAFSKIYKNVLNYKEIIEICEDFNKIINNVHCGKECRYCREVHLFDALYNIGLVGIVKIDLITNVRIQKFLEPQNRKLIITESTLPHSEVYILHPTLTHIIEHIRLTDGKEFQLSSDFIVGENYLYHGQTDNQEKFQVDSSKTRTI